MNQSISSAFDRADFYRRLKQYLSPQILDLEEDGDHLFQKDEPIKPLQNLKPAAVLIGIIEKENIPHVLLTTRTLALKSHSGQIAFPGGKIDDTDVSPQMAALREADEEIGLHSSDAQIIAQMPLYKSGSGYAIHPIIAQIKDNPKLQLNPDEVEDCFTVPLEFLMNPLNHHLESKFWQNQTRYFYTMPYIGKDGINRHIWGVTAGIIRKLYERLYVQK